MSDFHEKIFSVEHTGACLCDLLPCVALLANGLVCYSDVGMYICCSQTCMKICYLFEMSFVNKYVIELASLLLDQLL